MKSNVVLWYSLWRTSYLFTWSLLNTDTLSLKTFIVRAPIKMRRGILVSLFRSEYSFAPQISGKF